LFGWLWRSTGNWRARATYTGPGSDHQRPALHASERQGSDNHAIDQTAELPERAPVCRIFDDPAAYAAVRPSGGEKHLLGNLKFMTEARNPGNPHCASHAVMLTTAFIKGSRSDGSVEDRVSAAGAHTLQLLRKLSNFASTMSSPPTSRRGTAGTPSLRRCRRSDERDGYCVVVDEPVLRVGAVARVTASRSSAAPSNRTITVVPARSW
jgi:hypothetical protein